MCINCLPVLELLPVHEMYKCCLSTWKMNEPNEKYEEKSKREWENKDMKRNKTKAKTNRKKKMKRKEHTKPISN